MSDAHLPSSTLKDLLKRRAARWQLYAAVTSSAVTLAGARNIAAGLMPDVLQAQQLPSYPATPLSAALGSPLANPYGLLFKTEPALPDATTTPTIGAVVPASGTVRVIQPGEWVTIYGARLANTTAVWNGNFPTSLGGTSVRINGKPAYLSMVSPGQINLQAPDDPATGPVSVAVTTGAGTATAVVTLSKFSPSFLLLDPTHVAAIIIRPDRSGSYLNGAYDILGPAGNCFGYYTSPAKAGDVIEIFGVGFGPTNPLVPAGKAFSGAAPVSSALSLYLNNIPVQPVFAGISGAGLYQINVVVPQGIGQGDISIRASIGGMQTQNGPLFSLQGPTSLPPVCIASGDGDGGDGGDGGYGGGDGGYGGGDGGTGGGGGGGDGGGGDGDGGDGGGDGGCD
jgi:uncharacterized protein (TIGR03437 family)